MKSLLACCISFLIALPAFAQPANDTCESPALVMPGENTFTIDYSQATDSMWWYTYVPGAIDPTFHGEGPDVFYQVELEPGDRIEVLLIGNFGQSYMLGGCNPPDDVTGYLTSWTQFHYEHLDAEPVTQVLAIGGLDFSSDPLFVYVNLVKASVATQGESWSALKSRF